MGYKSSRGFKTIKIDGQNDIVADENDDELEIVAGSNITITVDSSEENDKLTIAASGGGGGGSSISDSDGDTKIECEASSDSDEITFQTGGTQRAVITSDGKIGIGVATPSRSLDVTGDLKVRGGDILGPHTSDPAIQMDADSNVTIPQNITIAGTTELNGVTYAWPSSDGSSGQQLQTDGSGGLSWAAAGSGGGSSSDYFVMRRSGLFRVNSTNSSRLYTQASPGADFSTYRTDIGSVSNTSFTASIQNSVYYYTNFVAPVDCTLERMDWSFHSGSADIFRARLWKSAISSSTSPSTTNVTWSEVASVENGSASSGSWLLSTEPSSGNSIDKGDSLAITFDGKGSYSDSYYKGFNLTFFFKVA